jgi:RNA polymerase sigma-54 factor
MALTQRLEFRQSQSLVMTPQLMQAIKLLQRASDGPEAPVAGEPTQERTEERAEFSDSGDSGSFGDDSGAEHSAEMAGASARDSFEPGQEEWMNRDLGTRTEMEQTLDTPLDNVFSEEPAEAAARAAQDAAPTA